MKKLFLFMMLFALFSQFALAVGSSAATIGTLAGSAESSAAGSADQKVQLILFSKTGCQHCASMELFLEELKKEQPLLEVKEYELLPNIRLFFEYARGYNLNVDDGISVPVVFIKEKVFVGYNSHIAEEIRSYVSQCAAEICAVPANETGNITQTIGQGTAVQPENNVNSITLSAVILGAIIDSINPCEFAILIILLTTILATGSRLKALYAGLAFSSSIFIAYFLMGIGLFSAIRAAGITRWFYILVAALAIVIGLFNLKDYLWYGKWFIMEVPLSWRPLMKLVVRGVTSVWGAFLVGFVVSLFLLPCTSGPYIVVLGLLAQAATRNSALLLLLLYNFIFVLPMLAITFAIYFGLTTTEQAEQWRERRLKVLHLIAGIIILVLGVGMFMAMWAGWI